MPLRHCRRVFAAARRVHFCSSMQAGPVDCDVEMGGCIRMIIYVLQLDQKGSVKVVHCDDGQTPVINLAEPFFLVRRATRRKIRPKHGPRFLWHFCVDQTADAYTKLAQGLQPPRCHD